MTILGSPDLKRPGGGSFSWADPGPAGTIWRAGFFGLSGPPLEGGAQPGILVRDVSSWGERVVRVWTGSAWATRPLYFWDGTAWKYMFEPGGGGTPIRFGYDEVLPTGSTTNLPGNTGRAYFTKFTLPTGGTVNHVGFYSPVSGSGLVKGLIYEDNAGSPGALVAVGAQVTTSTVGWHQSACAGEPITAGDYWLGCIHFDFQSATFCSASNGVDGWAQFGDSGYATPPDPWSGGSAADYDCAIYAEVLT